MNNNTHANKILIDAASMLMVKVNSPENFLEIFTETMYQAYLRAGNTEKKDFRSDETGVFETRIFIEQVASRLCNEEVKGFNLAEGLFSFMDHDGMNGFDGMLQAIFMAYGETCGHTNYSGDYMTTLTENLGALCELRDYLRKYALAEELVETPA